MERFRTGDHAAAGRLVEIFYPELRRIAAARMRAERTDHTLQPTAVVHQLYLELVKVKALRAANSVGEEFARIPEAARTAEDQRRKRGGAYREWRESPKKPVQQTYVFSTFMLTDGTTGTPRTTRVTVCRN